MGIFGALQIRLDRWDVEDGWDFALKGTLVNPAAAR
jgi:hypothetical protein